MRDLKFVCNVCVFNILDFASFSSSQVHLCKQFAKLKRMFSNEDVTRRDADACVTNLFQKIIIRIYLIQFSW